MSKKAAECKKCSSPSADINLIQTISRLTPDGVATKERTFDSCALVICCQHQKVVLSIQPNSQVVWLPFLPLNPKLSWHDGALAGSFSVLAGNNIELRDALEEELPYKEARILEVFRLQWPITRKFITRIIFGIRLKSIIKAEGFECCKDNGRLKWVDLQALTKEKEFNKPFWGPEMFQFACVMAPNTIRLQKIHEYTMEQAEKLVECDQPTTPEVELLQSASAKRYDVRNLFIEFIDHCFPSFFMSIWSFKPYMAKFGFDLSDSRMRRLFYAFNSSKCGYVNFQELLLGLASVDPGSLNGKLRLNFVFRFYDQSLDDKLFKEDFTMMVHEMFPALSMKKCHDKVVQLATQFGVFEADKKDYLTSDDLYNLVSTKKFVGTSKLCRVTKPVFPLIAKILAKRKLQQKVELAQVDRLNQVVSKKYIAETCRRCMAKPHYKLSPHMTRMTRNKELTHPKKLSKWEGEETTEIEKFLQAEHPATKLIAAIRHMERGSCNKPNGVLKDSPKDLINLIEALMPQIKSLFSVKCITVSSPVFVVGDIHGNLADLLTMESILWRHLPVGPSILFLGDYVDRGMWSVECALYVLALKALFPESVNLLRGNHEIRIMQQKYSFERECKIKYKDHGTKVFNMINEMFDQMPVAAVVDDAIFCAHGGIPHVAKTLLEINELPEIIKDEKDSELFWEIIWSDPIHDIDFKELVDLLQQESNGFVRNNKRGTGWYFSEKAADAYLERNQLTHIIRAHECPENGFTFHFGDKCTTIFSSSHYQRDNKCAVLFVDQQRIRVLCIDTSLNGPASPHAH